MLSPGYPVKHGAAISACGVAGRGEHAGSGVQLIVAVPSPIGGVMAGNWTLLGAEAEDRPAGAASTPGAFAGAWRAAAAAAAAAVAGTAAASTVESAPELITMAARPSGALPPMALPAAPGGDVSTAMPTTTRMLIPPSLPGCFQQCHLLAVVPLRVPRRQRARTRRAMNGTKPHRADVAGAAPAATSTAAPDAGAHGAAVAADSEPGPPTTAGHHRIATALVAKDDVEHLGRDDRKRRYHFPAHAARPDRPTRRRRYRRRRRSARCRPLPAP